jgi:hypothetical protein
MHALVDLLAQLGNLRLADPRQPHRLHQIVDPPGLTSAIPPFREANDALERLRQIGAIG